MSHEMPGVIQDSETAINRYQTGLEVMDTFTWYVDLVAGMRAQLMADGWTKEEAQTLVCELFRERHSTPPPLTGDDAA